MTALLPLPLGGAPASETAERLSVFEASHPRTLVEIFASSAAKWPYRPALEDANASLNYLELYAEAHRLSGELKTLGVGRGDRVGIRAPGGTAELYVAVLGVLFAGAAYVPVDFADPEARAQLVWKEAEVCAVVKEGLAVTRCWAPAGVPGPAGVADDCWVIFTSGSTGTPKGVVVKHRSAAAFVDAEATLWQVTEDDRVLAGLSVGFDASCEEMWLAWRNGAALVAAPRDLVRSGADLGPWLVEHAITVVSTVPSLAALWDERDLAKVRLLILGGEACPDQLGWRLAIGREVWNTYGPTEATVVSAAAQVKPGRPVTIGYPLPGWQVEVIDENGQLAAPGSPGELVIGGAGLGRYLDEALDAQRYCPLPALGWERAYRTGDMARETPYGLDYLGRRDGQVKIGGRRVELGEIDAQLSAVPGVRAAVAAVRKTPAGNPVLVAYIVGDVDPAAVRGHLVERLPVALVPRIVRVAALPLKSSGKVDRDALPWPPPASTDYSAGLAGTSAWLAERWGEQLGPMPLSPSSDFFELGGTSLGAARLVSVLRGRFPTVAVADVYNHRRLGDLADHLDHLAGATRKVEAASTGSHAWGGVQLFGAMTIIAIGALQWLLAVFAYNQWTGPAAGPRIGWLALLVGWLLVSSPPGRGAIVGSARRVLLRRLKPGRYPRHGWLACRVWFVERLATSLHVGQLAGTPWGPRYARLFGAEVGEGARLGSLPSPAGVVRIGAGATIEAEVDVRGWWVEDSEIVVGEISVGPQARVGTRSVLMPRADVGAGAEIEPGSVVTGQVPAGEKWAGSPARPVGRAGDGWPASPPAATTRLGTVATKARFAFGLAVRSLVPLVAVVPELFIYDALNGRLGLSDAPLWSLLVEVPLLVATYLLSYALVVGAIARCLSRLVRPGWHRYESATTWALWLTESLMTGTRTVLFPLYASLLTRPWLRLVGVRVGKRTEVSNAVKLNHLVKLGATSFVTDDVVFASTRVRDGWLYVSPIEVGDRSFLGNSAILGTGTKLGNDCLVGVLSSPPTSSAEGTSWFGLPALELPRVAERPDPSRTTSPSRWLVAGRASVEIVRMLLPGSVSLLIALGMFAALESVGKVAGPWGMLGAAPVAVLCGALTATAVTVAVKWLLMGRYGPGQHPFWSFFVWRDEVVNTCQEQLSGPWLLNAGLGSPLVPPYLRAMGAKVGKDVWFETMNITEFDVVALGDGCVVNHGACIETHLFHDRLMQIGPALLGERSTLGPNSVVLPDTVLGAGCSVGARSVVLRGEKLPPHTRWHGAPVEPF
jgi:non-ribosomal peptide synthetase-like protein